MININFHRSHYHLLRTRSLLVLLSLAFVLRFSAIDHLYASIFQQEPPVAATDTTTPTALVPLPNIAQLAAGSDHTCVLTVGGSVQCWGANDYGQLGDGSLTVRTLPVNVTGLTSGVKTIAAGGHQSCAVMQDGGVKCWGGFDGSSEGAAALTTNAAAIAGTRARAESANVTNTVPIDIQGLNSTITEVAVGERHSCALTAVGGVKCWAIDVDDYYYYSYIVTSTTPVDIHGLTSDIQAITTGNDHLCVLTNAGGVKCLGANYYGQLGNGTNAESRVPVDVTGLTSGVIAIRAASDHTCALLTSTAIQCWGENYSGQLGDGSMISRSNPVDVVGLNSDVATLAIGGAHSCAVLNNGAAKCWGNNSAGQVGDSSTTRRTIPVDVVTLNRNVTQLTAGDSHTCALLTTGIVKCWGSNSSGQLGNGVSSTRATGIDVVGLSSGISTIAAGNDTSCAVTTGGGAQCWGANYYGQIGDGTTTNRPAPVDVINLSEVSKIVNSGYHSCALSTTGALRCWGYNPYGQLGDGTTTMQLQPVNVIGLNSGVIDLAIGNWHSCALLNTGGVKCWGYNGYGQLGDNTNLRRETPVDVFGLTSGVKAIAAGEYHSCALLTSGSVRCWGANYYGQIGDGTTTSRPTPVNSIGLSTGVSAVSAGGDNSCALLSNGALRCWGANYYGQIGDGTTTNRPTPVGVSGLSSGVGSVAVATYHTCAVTAAGIAKCWGANYSGQLGDGTTTNRTIPVDVLGLSDSLSAAAIEATTEKTLLIAPGGSHTCALTINRGVKCWGANNRGQLGDSSSWRTIPDDVITPCRTLTVTLVGTGNALTVSPPNSLGCLASNYVSGEVIALTAAPAPEWQVAGWTGTINNTSTLLNNTIIMPEGDHTASVTYSQGCYTLTHIHSGSGSEPTAIPTNSPACPAGQYVVGEAISLSATPAGGWAISGWNGTANDSSTAPNNTLQMPAHNHTIGVTYIQPCYTLTRLHSGAGSDPTVEPANSASCGADQFVSGEMVTLSAVPADGWTVSGWSGAANTTDLTTALVMPMNDQTVNVSYSRLPDTSVPAGSDAFEEDDTCATAKPITSDGLGQERNFHKPGDTDWVHFDTTGGTTYRIEVQVSNTAPTDVNLELYPTCESAAADKFSATFAPGVRLDYTATDNRTLYLRLSDIDPTLAGAHVTYHLSVRRLQTVDNPNTPNKGVLVLVAGRLKNPDPVQKNINFVTQLVYDLYKENGYSDEDIQYLTTDPSMPGYDKPATLANLQEAIVTWAASKLAANRQLTLYLMDHGDVDKFFLDGVTQQVLTPAQLSEWLDQLEAAVPGVTVTVVIEACYSGSFIKSLQRVSKPGRLIIASTTADTVAYASSAGAYFSDQLVYSLRQGYSLHNSFRAAYVVARELTRLLQEPWLDGNGNGIPNEAEDVALASQRGLGYTDRDTNDSWSPYVVNVQGPTMIVDRRGAIVAEVRDNKRVRRVWAVIYPPSYQPPSDSQELVPETLPTIVLPLQSKDTFGSEYPGFDEPGLYRIAVYAEDDDGLIALPKVINVQNGEQVFLPVVSR